MPFQCLIVSQPICFRYPLHVVTIATVLTAGPCAPRSPLLPSGPTPPLKKIHKKIIIVTNVRCIYIYNRYNLTRALIGWKSLFYQSIQHKYNLTRALIGWKSLFYQSIQHKYNLQTRALIGCFIARVCLLFSTCFS
jgi:hypothetical protein